MLQAAAGEGAGWTGKGNAASLTRHEFLGFCSRVRPVWCPEAAGNSACAVS
jgi:hypothetical protein